MERDIVIQGSIISDMSEGVMVVRPGGIIGLVNDAALNILEKKREALVGKSFARVFFDSQENDEWVQSVLDAVYDMGKRKENYVPYRTAQDVKQLRVVSSCLRNREEIIGIILVISDITELTEMRDAVRAMQAIRELNGKLELRNRVLQETFGRYLSDDVARQILDSPEGWKLGGQRQNLTILMSDLRGFTAMSERMKPQSLIKMLNHYFSEMYEEIERYHGTLIEFLGDGMLVIFGAPILRKSHASDAVAAAIGMQKRMEAVNRWNAEQGYEPLSMGIGINTDCVIIGNIGSEKRTKYGVLGAAVNLTGRIEGYTVAGQILISSGTLAAAQSELQILRTIPVSPKGIKSEILLSEVIGIGAPYNLQLPQQQHGLKFLSRSAAVRFSLVEEKYIDKHDSVGEILAVSQYDALLKTEENLSVLDNLCIDIGDDLYAKLIEKENGNYLLSFTARPPCFSAWLNDICS